MYYPNRSRPPRWVHDFLAVVAASEQEVGSRTVDGLKSDLVLAALRPGLLKLNYQVEGGKKLDQRIRRPVLFGENGEERVSYEVDAVHDEYGIAVEIEAGRGARGNAVYRDLIRASLLVDVKYLVLGVMLDYRHKTGEKDTHVASYKEARAILDAVYNSGRLVLPFEGLLLFGY